MVSTSRSWKREGWNTLGTGFRAILDFGYGITGWRGAYLNEGEQDFLENIGLADPLSKELKRRAGSSGGAARSISDAKMLFGSRLGI